MYLAWLSTARRARIGTDIDNDKVKLCLHKEVSYAKMTMADLVGEFNSECKHILTHKQMALIEQHILDTNAGKQVS